MSKARLVVAAMMTIAGASSLEGQAVEPARPLVSRSASSRVASFDAPVQQAADRRDPTLAGIMSFIIPGVGSFYAGNSGHGLRHLGIHLGSYVLIGAAAASCDYDCSSNAGMVGLGALALLANDVWSIFVAVNDAKAHNGAAPGRVVGSLHLSPELDGFHAVDRPDGHGTAADVSFVKWKF